MEFQPPLKLNYAPALEGESPRQGRQLPASGRWSSVCQNRFDPVKQYVASPFSISRILLGVLELVGQPCVFKGCLGVVEGSIALLSPGPFSLSVRSATSGFSGAFSD